MKSRVAILLLVLSFSQSMAQEDAIQLKIDSLLAIITPNMSDTAKAGIYHSIGALSDNMDTTIKYASLSNALCYEKYMLLLATTITILARDIIYKTVRARH